jgi:hypothetical protein
VLREASWSHDTPLSSVRDGTSCDEDDRRRHVAAPGRAPMSSGPGCGDAFSSHDVPRADVPVVRPAARGEGERQVVRRGATLGARRAGGPERRVHLGTERAGLAACVPSNG